MALLSHSEFEARYGEVARRLFDFDQPTFIPTIRPNLIFRRPLDWPVIPLPGNFDGMCRYVDKLNDMKEWFGHSPDRVFWDHVLPNLYFWFFEREARWLLWAPMIETLARHGPVRAVVFELERSRLLNEDGSLREIAGGGEDWSVGLLDPGIDPVALRAERRLVVDWHAAEDTIAAGLPLKFDG